MINKNKLVFDPADTGNSDFVGSYVLSSNGTKITHTNVSGKDGLDVNIVNASIVVTATDLDIRDLSHSQDSIKVGDGTDFLAINADGSINITDNGGSLTVDAVNLDIRDLVFATDKVDVSGSSVSVTALPGSLQGYADGSVWAAGSFGAEFLAVRKDAAGALTGVADGDFSPLQVNANGELKVSATFDAAGDYAEDSAHISGDIGLYMLSVREDTLASSTSASGDYQSFKTDALGRIWANNTHQTMANAAVSVLATATDLVGSDLANRKRIMIQNLGSKKIYIGKDATVTTVNGLELFPGGSMELDIGPSINIHAISSSGTQDVRVMELA